MREFLREHPPLVGFGAAILVVLTVFLGADLFSVLVGRHSYIPSSPLRPAAASPSPAAAVSDKVIQDLEVVMRRTPPPSPAASPASQTAPAGSEVAMGPVSGGPGVTLQGVMLGGGVGIAVLEVDGQSYTVGVGDTAGGYTVAEIMQDQVVLRRGGEVVSLGLSGSGSVEVSGEVPSDGPPVLPPPDAVPPPPAPAPAGSAPAALPAPPVVLDTQPPAAAAAPSLAREEINAFLDQGAALALEVRGEMYVGAGDQQGVRLKFRKPDNALAKLGLKDGDVVMTMNGEPIRSPEELYNSYLILKNTPSVDFQILRNGEPSTVHFDFE